MATVYNAPKSQWNKDETFAALNITEGKKIEFSEATFKANEERIVVYAYVTAVESVTDYGNKALSSENWEPQLCKFSILKKETTVKEKTIKPTPGMLIAAHLIEQIGTDKFSGSFDFSKNQGDYVWLVLGQNSEKDPTPLPEQMKELLAKQNRTLTAIESLDKLKDVTIPDLGKYDGSRKGGYSGQTEKAKLEDRASFLLAQLEPGSTFHQIAEKLDYTGKDATSYVGTLVGDLLSRVIR